MDRVSRRTIAVSAALLLSSSAAAGAKAASRRRTPTKQHLNKKQQRRHRRQGPPAKPNRPEPVQHSSDISLVPTFSCGSIWTEATQCSQLCVADEGCPDGQQCYAGIPCPQDQVEERQRAAEQAEMDAHMERMKRDYVNRFVCGETYDEAVLSCGGTVSSSSFDATSPMTTHFCPSGLSSQCPSGMQCYAAVSCPRGSVDEEDDIVFETLDWDRLQRLSSFVTEPILYDSTPMELNEFSSVGSSVLEIALHGASFL